MSKIFKGIHNIYKKTGTVLCNFTIIKNSKKYRSVFGVHKTGTDLYCHLYLFV